MRILFEKFERKSFLDVLDDYRCNEYYMQLLNEFKADNRIDEIRKSLNIWKTNIRNIANIHYMSLHKNEEIIYLEKY
jgi:hypothetical protein